MYQPFIIYFQVTVQPLQGIYLMFLVDFIHSTISKDLDEEDSELISLQTFEQFDLDDKLLSGDIGVLQGLLEKAENDQEE